MGISEKSFTASVVFRFSHFFVSFLFQPLLLMRQYSNYPCHTEDLIVMVGLGCVKFRGYVSKYKLWHTLY